MGALFARLMPSSKGEPIRVCMLGLDAAGKTTVLHRLKLSDCTRTLPTIGFNVETVTPCKGLTLTIWDIGGQDKIRQLWKHYYTSTEGLIYVVDSADDTRFGEAASELNAILNEHNMVKIPLVVLANKQDLPGAVTSKEMEGILQLNELSPDYMWHVQECCASKGTGVFEAMSVLAKFIKKQKKESQPNARKDRNSSTTSLET
uniref:ADP-ribosylation factor-like protein 14 n=1 Tax=Ciona intestinalis TaxID=7719 RepID=A0A1W5B8I0_CIOIN|nr:ADP-ribosylation factor 6-like [Ciona intestinalis]|eukprot:XP_002131392.1 ADP-ribosylation factor 6-like [Ciona intestinalis]